MYSGTRQEVADKLARALSDRSQGLTFEAGTLMLCEGVHIRVVQELLGHATVSMTLDTYSHLLPGMGDETAWAMDPIFN